MTEPKAIDISRIPQAEHIYCPTTGELCHIVRRMLYDTPGYTRDDIVPTKESLQVARVRSDAGKVFKPHQHKAHDAPKSVKGECWVVISGRAEAHLYGMGNCNTYIKSVVLCPGDVLVTLRGGHGYRILDDSTIVVEVKGGPYTGVYDDKEFIKYPSNEPRSVSELWKHNDSFKDVADGRQNEVSHVRRPEGQASADVPGVLGEDGKRAVEVAAAEAEMPAVRTSGAE